MTPTAPGSTAWTPGAAVARARQVVREEGARALVMRALGEMGYRRLLLFERDVAAPLSNAATDIELRFGFLEESDLDAYERLRPGERAAAQLRLASGTRCFGSWARDELATVRWVASGAPYIDYLGVALPLAGGELYHFDSFTSPSFRRRSVSTVSQDELVKALRADDTVRLLRAVHPENRAALRDAAKARFVEAGRISVTGRGRAGRVAVRRRR